MNAGDIERRKRALSIFDAIAELGDEERRRRIDALCGGDHDLRAQVQALLDADEGATEPVSGDVRAWRELLADAAPALEVDVQGRLIGAWRITGLLGRGGMGAVYGVERADGAYVQRAALKRVQGENCPRPAASGSCANARCLHACSIRTSRSCSTAVSMPVVIRTS